MGPGLEAFTTLCFLTATITATVNVFVKVIQKNFTAGMATPGSPAFRTFETQFKQQVKRVAGVMGRAPLSVHQAPLVLSQELRPRARGVGLVTASGICHLDATRSPLPGHGWERQPAAL